MRKLTAKQQSILQQSIEETQGNVLNQIQQVQIKQYDLAPNHQSDRRSKLLPLTALNSIPTRKHGANIAVYGAE